MQGVVMTSERRKKKRMRLWNFRGKERILSHSAQTRLNKLGFSVFQSPNSNAGFAIYAVIGTFKAWWRHAVPQWCHFGSLRMPRVLRRAVIVAVMRWVGSGGLIFGGLRRRGWI